MELVYGVVGELLVFIKRDEAERLASINHALRTSKTWGKLRAALPPDAYADVLELADIEKEEAARPSFQHKTFSLEDIPAFFDGDFPGWPAQDMIDWVPPDIQNTYGRRSASAINGDFLKLDVDRCVEIVAAFEGWGYRCVRNEVLVGSASGY